MEHLLEDPDVAVLLEEHHVEGGLQEVLEDAALRLVEVPHAVKQLLVLERGLALQLLEDELVELLQAGAAVGLLVEGGALESVEHVGEHLLDEAALELEEEQLEVVAEEVAHHEGALLVDLAVALQLREVAQGDGAEDQLGQDGEDAVVVVLADGEINVVSRNHVVVQRAQLLQVQPLPLVRVLLHVFFLKALPQLQKLHCVLRRLLEYDQAVDVPSIEAHSVVPVVDQLSEEFEGDDDDLVIGVEGIEAALDDGREELGVKPVEENVEGLGVAEAAQDAAQDVEEPHDVLAHARRLLHGLRLHAEEMLDFGEQLVEVAGQLRHELLRHPEAGQNAVELAQLLHLRGALQDIELVDVRLG